MAGHVYAAISHKGGAGRSTAAANAAFQAANQGHAVCLVDFDLDSATLGSVLGLADAAVGGNQGIQSLLARDRNPGLKPAQLLVDLHEARYRDSRGPDFTGASPGAFRLLPGNVRQRALVSDEEMAKILGETLEWLASTFQVVIVDVRAGKSEALRALLYGAIPLEHFSLLLFYRWTHQHLSAAADMIETLEEWGDAFGSRPPVLPISTAHIPRSDVIDHAWFAHQYDELEVREDREIAKRLDRRPRRIPFDRVFQWKEQVLSGPRSNGAEATITAFRDLATDLSEGAA